MRWIASVLVVASALAAVAGCAATAATPATPEVEHPYEPVISVTGRVVPAEWASVSPQIGGAIADVVSVTGEDVEAGAVLVRLDATDAKLAVVQAEASLRAAEAQLAVAMQGARSEELAVARARVDAAAAFVAQAAVQQEDAGSGAAGAQIAEARARVAAAEAAQRAAREAHEQTMKCRNVTLDDGTKKQVCPALGAVEEQARHNLHAANEALAAARANVAALTAGSGIPLRAADAALDGALANQAVAEAQLELLGAPPRGAQVAVAEAGVAQAQAALSTARAALARYEVRAPFAGTLGAVAARRGEVVLPGQPVATIGDLSTLRVETTDLDEIDVGRVSEGSHVLVTFDGLPGQVFSGSIVRIAPMATPGTGGVNYTAVIELDDVPPAIRWGMTAFVDIEAE